MLTATSKLADAYLAAVAEKKRNGEHKSALVVSPTHAEADRITRGDSRRVEGARQARQGTHRHGMGSHSPDGCREIRPDAI